MKNHNHKGIKGKQLILLCCLAPIVTIVLISLNDSGTISSGGRILSYLLMLLCPLWHLIIMPHGQEEQG